MVRASRISERPNNPCLHHRLGRYQQSRNRGSVLERGTDDLGRINDALGNQITVLPLLRIVTGLCEMLPQPPLTRNQIDLMQIDTTASENMPGLRALGILPRSLEAELEAMLRPSK